MLVRKCDTETAEALQGLDRIKLLAIIELDSLQTETAIKAAATFVHRLAEKEQGKA